MTLHQIHYDGKGVPTLDGHAIHALNLTLEASAVENICTIQLDAVPLITGAYRVHLTASTERALVAMGWQPPREGVRVSSLPQPGLGESNE